MNNNYPEGAQLQQFLKRRRQKGILWRSLFLLATTLGVLVLMVLLLTIINDSFGYVAIQYKIEPETLLLQHHKNRVLEAPLTETSEDDDYLATRIGAQEHAVGFFSMAYYQAHADALRPLSIDGIAPTADAIASGEYLLSRPLFLVTTVEALQQRGPTAFFTGYYLDQVNQLVEALGYVRAPDQALRQSMEDWQRSTGLTPDTVRENLQLRPSDSLTMVGSSTLMPLTQAMVKRLRQDGVSLPISVTDGGTATGLQALCEGAADIALASRPLQWEELQSCQRNHLTPIAFRIATDGIVVVVNQNNGWVDDLTKAEVQLLFTDARHWSDVRPTWPSQPVSRWVPGPDSGTLDVFVTRVFGDDLQAQPQ